MISLLIALISLPSVAKAKFTPKPGEEDYQESQLTIKSAEDIDRIFAKDKRGRIKARASYEFYPGQKLNLRVAQIPTNFPWVEKDLEGKVLPPKVGDIVISQTVADLDLGNGKFLPGGTRFYGRVKSLTAPRRFQKDGHVVMEFFKLEVGGHEIAFGDSSVEVSTEREKNLKSKLKKAGTVGAYTLAGAAGGAFMVYKIGGLALASNPYALAGGGALGATLGLATGIFKKGKLYNLEPGTDLALELDSSWLVYLEDNNLLKDEKGVYLTDYDLYGKRTNKFRKNNTPSPVDLKIISIGTSKNIYGQKSLAVTLRYYNPTRNMLRHSSFKLLDSMGKEYEPTPRNFADEFFGELPKAAEMTLYYPVEFLKAPHVLKVVRWLDQKVLAAHEVLLR